MWAKAKKYLKSIGWIAKLMTWVKIPIPQLGAIQVVLSGIILLGDKLKAYILNTQIKDAEANVKKSEEIAVAIEAERAKPIEQQNNDVLRDQMRKRHE